MKKIFSLFKTIIGIINLLFFLMIVIVLVVGLWYFSFNSISDNDWVSLNPYGEKDVISLNVNNIKIRNNIIEFEEKLENSEKKSKEIYKKKIDMSLSNNQNYVEISNVDVDIYDGLDNKVSSRVEAIAAPIMLKKNSIEYYFLKLQYDNYKKLKPLKVAIVVEIILFIIVLIGVVLYYKRKIKLLETDTAKQQVEQDNSDNNSNEIENNNGI